MLKIIAPYILPFVVVVAMTALVITVYQLLLHTHDKIMNEKTKKTMKYRILTNNCLHVKDVESPLTLAELQCELEGKRWLRVEGAIIATQSIDAIVEVEEENNE